jgi:hypothetical protein
LGAVDVPVYPTLPANQIAYILKDSGARAILVSTREQLAKILEIRDGLPDLLLTVAFDDPGSAPDVRSYASVMEEGQRYIAGGHAGSFRERALAVKPDDVATLIYTSGTTGDPKGVMLTHFNLMSNVAGSQQHGLSNVIMNGDRTLSFLPLSHVFERMVDYLYWDVGCVISYAESMEKVVDNMGEVKPNIAVSVPRLFEKIYTRVTGATGIKKKLVRWAVRVGGGGGGRAAGREGAVGVDGAPVPPGGPARLHQAARPDGRWDEELRFRRGSALARDRQVLLRRRAPGVRGVRADRDVAGDRGEQAGRGAARLGGEGDPGGGGGDHAGGRDPDARAARDEGVLEAPRRHRRGDRRGRLVPHGRHRRADAGGLPPHHRPPQEHHRHGGGGRTWRRRRWRTWRSFRPSWPRW